MTLLFETILDAPINSVFEFFARPARLELLHPNRPRVRVLRCEDRVRTGAAYQPSV